MHAHVHFSFFTGRRSSEKMAKRLLLLLIPILLYLFPALHSPTYNKYGWSKRKKGKRGNALKRYVHHPGADSTRPRLSLGSSVFREATPAGATAEWSERRGGRNRCPRGGRDGSFSIFPGGGGRHRKEGGRERGKGAADERLCRKVNGGPSSSSSLLPPPPPQCRRRRHHLSPLRSFKSRQRTRWTVGR